MIRAADFISQTSLFFATGRKNGLPDVDSALAKYNRFPTPENARELADAIINWAVKKGLKANGDINTNRNPAVVRQLVVDVSNVPGGEALKNLRLAVAGGARTRASSAVQVGGLAARLIAGVIDELNKCKDFACTDVGTFSGDINAALPRTRWQEIYDKGTKLGGATGIPMIPKKGGNGEWGPSGLRAAYTRVYDRQAGECTSFANAAAHLLSTHKPLAVMPRIEIVSFRNQRKIPRTVLDRATNKRVPLFKKDANGNFTTEPVMESQYVTHVFCVVGRSGDEVAFDGKMPPSDTWGDDARIVDCWLGALGYECSFRVKEYPKPGYLTTGHLFKEMDSFLGESAVRGTAHI